jgi:regulator of sigma E protease
VTILPAFDAQAARYRVGAYFLPVAYTNEILKLEAAAPLRLAGLRAGDRIVAVNAERIETAVRLLDLLDLLAAAVPGDPLTLTVSRASVELDVSIAGSTDRARLLDGATFANLGVDRRRAGPIGGFVLGARQVGEDLRLIGESLRGLLTGRIAARDAVAGPVGMAYLLGQSVSAGASAFLRLLSLLSLSLGLFNLIPFPALDGSRAAFAFYEAVRRRPIPPEREGVVHAIGFLVLIALLLLVTYQDLVRLLG